jgi:hypothetical protein
MKFALFRVNGGHINLPLFLLCDTHVGLSFDLEDSMRTVNRCRNMQQNSICHKYALYYVNLHVDMLMIMWVLSTTARGVISLWMEE